MMNGSHWRWSSNKISYFKWLRHLCDLQGKPVSFLSITTIVLDESSFFLGKGCLGFLGCCSCQISPDFVPREAQEMQRFFVTLFHQESWNQCLDHLRLPYGKSEFMEHRWCVDVCCSKKWCNWSIFMELSHSKRRGSFQWTVFLFDLAGEATLTFTSMAGGNGCDALRSGAVKQGLDERWPTGLTRFFLVEIIRRYVQLGGGILVATCVFGPRFWPGTSGCSMMPIKHVKWLILSILSPPIWHCCLPPQP